jgi:alanine racemase
METAIIMHTRPVWAEISRHRLIENYRQLRLTAGDSADVLAVVKANAYGHGILGCAPLLVAAGAKWIGVTCVEEGVAVRAVCPQARVLVMSGLWQGEAEAVVEYQLTPLGWEPFHLDLLEREARARGLGPQSIPVHVEIDTGMSRQGVRSAEALGALLTRFTRPSPLALEGVMTHFSAPEVMELGESEQQISRLGEALELITARGLRPKWVHAGNSATLLAGKDTGALHKLAVRSGSRLMLRPGLTLYGYPPRFSPADPMTSAARHSYEPVLEWKTRVVSLRWIEAGESAGYNSAFRAQRRTCLALLPLGYADGVNRLLSNRGAVLVRGRRAPIAGRVSMDQTIIDATGVPGVDIGDEVVILGAQGSESITAYDIADAIGTIPFEVLCGIACRVPRVLVD